MISNKITDNFINNLKDNEKIKRIYVRQKKNEIVFTIITEDKDIEVENKIVSAFINLIKSFKEFNFDFIILPLFNRNYEDLIPNKSKLVYSN